MGPGGRPRDDRQGWPALDGPSASPRVPEAGPRRGGSMSAPAFRSRWAGWDPAAPPIFPDKSPQSEPAEPPEPGFEGFAGAIPVRIPGNRGPSGDLDREACTRCGSPLADPGDVLCGACYASRRGPRAVLTFDPRRRLRTIAWLSGRQCGDCGAIDWYVTHRGDATCRTCARGRGAITETGTASGPGDAA